MSNRELGVALLVLRVGAGVFLLLFGVDKLVAPATTLVTYRELLAPGSGDG